MSNINAEESEYSLKDAHRAVKEEEKALTLAVNPSEYKTDNQYEELRRRGKATETDYYDNRAFSIFDIVGNLDDSHYDLLHSKHLKKVLWNRWFNDNPTLATEKDDYDNDNETPYHKRKQRQAMNEFLDAVIHAVWGVIGIRALQSVKDECTGQQIKERLTAFQYREYSGLTGFTALLEVLFNRGGHLSRKPIAQLRWLLSQFGVKMASRQVMIEGKRMMIYSIDGESIEVMNQLIQERHEYLATKNRIEDNYSIPILAVPNHPTRNTRNGDRLPIIPPVFTPQGVQLRV